MKEPAEKKWSAIKFWKNWSSFCLVNTYVQAFVKKFVCTFLKKIENHKVVFVYVFLYWLRNSVNFSCSHMLCVDIYILIGAMLAQHWHLQFRTVSVRKFVLHRCTCSNWRFYPNLLGSSSPLCLLHSVGGFSNNQTASVKQNKPLCHACNFTRRRRVTVLPCITRLHAVSAKLLNWEKRPFSFFSPFWIYRYCIFQYHFLHKQLWDQHKNEISYSVELRAAADNGSNSILTIFQILQSCHARQNREPSIEKSLKFAVIRIH